MTRLSWISLVCLLVACGSVGPKGQGEECYGTTECDVGLICNTALTPAVCTPGNDMLPIDAAVPNMVDAPVNMVDAPVNMVDAPVNMVDAPIMVDAPVMVDAMEPDAMEPDAMEPDAMEPDAMEPDAMVPDAMP